MESAIMAVVMFVSLCLAVIMAAVAAVVVVAAVAWAVRLARSIVVGGGERIPGPFEWLGAPWL